LRVRLPTATPRRGRAAPSTDILRTEARARLSHYAAALRAVQIQLQGLTAAHTRCHNLNWE